MCVYTCTNRANEVNNNIEFLLHLLQALHEALPQPFLVGSVRLSRILDLLGIILLDDPGKDDVADGCEALLLVAGVPVTTKEQTDANEKKHPEGVLNYGSSNQFTSADIMFVPFTAQHPSTH
jgi:hypothetical protein